MARAARRFLFAAGALLLLAGCRGPDATDPDQSVPLFVRADLTASAATSVVVVVTASDIPTALVFNLTVSNGTASGTITLPVGSARTITMHAYDAGGVETHRGSGTFDIHAGTNPTIVLALTPLAGDVVIDVTLGSLVITVTPAAETLAVAGTGGFSASIVDGLGAPVLKPVVWGSMNPGVATVASTGDRTVQVTAVAPGSTTIVATFGGAAGSATVIVSANPSVQLVSSGFNQPVYLTQPPADTSRLFVVEQPGFIRLVKNGSLLGTDFLDISSLVLSGGERGLLSIAFHPNYANNGHFFVAYTDRPNGNVQVARYTVSANPDVANAGSAQLIINVSHSTFGNHNGGQLAFGPDGYLYFSIGDGGGANNQLRTGQDTTVLLAKILRLDVNGALPYVVPPSNPFVGRAGRDEIWAWGLRNPWRFSFDRQTGDLYIADVGQGRKEEVNFQPANSTGGQNYGWSIFEGTLCFDVTPCSSVGITQPVFEYDHSGAPITGCSITGGYVYRGAKLPLLRGHYFFADYCSGWVRSFRLVGDVVQNLTDYTPRFGILGNITSLGQDSRGELYILLQGGSVYRIVPAP
jgi:glucose/arabinose dehydrogenase